MISVALCTYNGSKYLAKQLDSILNQEDYVPDEIIICDDNSTDNTIEVLSRYKSKYPKIINIHQNEFNLGSNLNFKKAISLCTGDYIFLSDQDDLWKKDKTKKTITFLNNHPEIEAVFTNADLIDDNDKISNNATLWDAISFFEKELPKPIAFLSTIALNGNIATGATMCFKGNWKKEIVSIIKKTGNLHDELIAKKLAFNSKLGYIAENLTSYRIHQNQQVGIKKKSKIKAKLRVKRIALGLEVPKNTIELRHLFVKQYSRYKTFINLHYDIDLEQNNVKQKALIQASKKDCEETLSKIKKSNFLLYIYFILIDKITRKRQL
ncbi:glycosyltransferase [Flavobacterium faecale]|uniref:glycosyltransferase n=1 Tax=Flavobacterium faecale TaxID=1355330 RepID=UPI003AAC14A7